MNGLLSDSEGLLGGLAEGIKGFIGGMEAREERDLKKIEMNAKIKADQDQKKRQRTMDAADLQSKGYLVPENQEALYDEPLKKDPNWVDPNAAFKNIQGQYYLSNIDNNRLKIQQDKAKEINDMTLKGYKYTGDDPNTGLPQFEMTEEAKLKEALDSRKREAEIKNLEASANRSNSAAKASDRKGRGGLGSGGGGANLVPGFIHDGKTFLNTKVEVPKLQQVSADADNINRLIRSAVNKINAASKIQLMDPTSEVSASLKNDLRDIQLTYKGKSFAELGVLAGPDMGILEDIFEDPTKFSATNLFKSKDGIAKRLSEAQNRINNRVDSVMASRGFRRGGAPAPGGGQTPPQTPKAPAKTLKGSEIEW